MRWGSTSAYRPDIDGLRAVSVLAVLLFHAGLGVSGGFVGVDVFFVISGYLITGLIVRDLKANQFRMSEFWERRLRRIWPASLAVIASVLLAGWLFLLPSDYRDLSGDAIAQLFMAANVRYWLGTDYFAAASDLRPLLHTWSLAVEEQFYLLYPLVLVGLWRVASARLPIVLGVLCLLSFIASVVGAERSPSAAFYLLPYRAWELQLGGLLALVPAARRPRIRQGDLLALVGLSAIVASCLIYDRRTVFPGVAAMPVCLGAALVIFGCSVQGSAVARALSLPLLRWIGLVSYSLYLWHWPIFALLRYRYGLDLPMGVAVGGVFASVICAGLSYRYIETPFRRLSAGSAWRHTLVSTLSVSLVLFGLAMWIRLERGFPIRVPEVVARFDSKLDIPRQWDAGKAWRERMFIPIGSDLKDAARPCFLFLGDSHGIAISASVDRVARELSLSGVSSLRGAFPPLPGVWRPGARDASADARDHALFDARLDELLKTDRPRHVIMAACWSGYLSSGHTDNGPDDRFTVSPAGSKSATADGARAALAGGVRHLADVCGEIGAQLWILLEVPRQPTSAKRRAIDAWLSDSLSYEGIDRPEHLRQTKVVRDVLNTIRSPNVHLIDLSDALFDSRGISVVGRDGNSWYVDDDHLSERGAQEALTPILRQLMQGWSQACQ